MSKLIVITAPNSSLPEERDAVEKELQARMGDRAIVAVLHEGWSASEFNLGESLVAETSSPRQPKTIESVIADAKMVTRDGPQKKKMSFTLHLNNVNEKVVRQFVAEALDEAYRDIVESVA